MATYSLKFLIKHKKRIKICCLALLIILALVTAIVDLFLAVSKNPVANAVSDKISYKVSINGLYFLPPNKIILNGTALTSEIPLDKKRVLMFPRISAKFSWAGLIFNGKINIENIDIDKPKMEWDDFNHFLRNNYKRIIEFLKSLPKGDVEIAARKWSFELTPKPYGPDRIFLDLVFRLREDTVTLFGSMYDSSQKDKQKPLFKYLLKGETASVGFFIDQCVLSSENMYTKLWGNHQNDIVRLMGFSSFNTWKSKANMRNNREKQLNIIQRIKFFLPVLKGIPVLKYERSFRDIYFTNINLVAKITFPDIEIEQFDMAFNNAPLSLKGNLYLDDPVRFDVGLKLYPAASNDAHFEELDRTDLNLSGKLENDVFHVDSALDLYFRGNSTSMGSLEKIKFLLNGLVFDFHRYPELALSLHDGNVDWHINKNGHRVTLSGLKASMHMDTDRLKEIQVNSSAYGGVLSGKVWIDTGEQPFRINAEAKLRDVNANELEELLIHFSKIHGKLDGTVVYASQPQFDLKGEINIHNGNLRNYEFFKWLSESFTLPELLDIHFNKARTKFMVDPDQAGIYDIELDSDDFKLNGFYYINDNGLVSSKLTSYFSRKILTESAKCRPMLKFFEKSTPYIDFDFQLSGDEHAMNFMWLPSATKKKVQDTLPDFIERIIDRRVNNSL